MNYDQRYQSGGGNSRAVSTTRAPTQDLRAPEIAMSELSGVRIGGVSIVPQSLPEIMSFATLMSQSRTAVRKHLRDNPGACFAVAMLAFRTGMDPFALASKSFEVNDQIAYESQAIAAIIIKNAPVVDRPEYSYTGDGNNRRCTVSVTTKTGRVYSYESPAIGNITPKNSPLWKSDPDQQLGYYSIRALARKHFPDVILGVYDLDEAEGMKDVSPAAQVAPPAKARVTDALDALSSKRRPVQTVVAEIDGASDPEPEEPQGEPDDGEDGFEAETGEIQGEPNEHPEGAACADEGASTVTIPEMPEQALAMWDGKGRWSQGWKWLVQISDEVEPQILAHLCLRHDDLLTATANHNEAAAEAVAALKQKAGL